MAAADNPLADQIVARTSDFEIGIRDVGAFTRVRIRGKYVDKILDELRTHVFRARTSFAVDASGLTDMTVAFARELFYTADLLRATDHRLVLLNPPDRLRSLLSLTSGGPPLATFLSEAQLTGDARESDSRAIHAAHELERIQHEIQSNKFWQFIDREGTWLCPYCAEPQADVRISSHMSVGAAAAEKVYRHLWHKCVAFAPIGPKHKSLEELEAALKRANQDKIVVTKRHIDALESKVTKLQGQAKEAEALALSVKIASERQQRLLPAAPPNTPGLEIDMIFRPASHVSGDFFDFVPLPDGRLGFLIGDVSGHGIEAGILMGMAKKVLALRLEEYGDPAQAVRRANADLFRELDRMSFVTAFVGVYDPARHSITAARAGHTPALIFNPGRKPNFFEFQPNGPGLGLSKGEAFDRALESRTLQILPGDFFFLYTDGLTEAHNPSGEEFGTDRIVRTFEVSAGRTTTFILSALYYEIDLFTASQPLEDDISAIGLRFIDPNAEAAHPIA